LISFRGLVALAAAATLAPLWDYGFEARHDNLVLTGILLMWCAVRGGSGAKLTSYLLAGSLAVVLQFLALKSFVYTVPIVAAAMAFPPFGAAVRRWKLALSLLAGALASFLALRTLYGSIGLWGGYLDGGRGISNVAFGGSRFAPWTTLTRTLLQSPLLLALVVAALISLVASIAHCDKRVLSWDGYLPEGCLFAISMAGLFLNPTPFAYNLVHVVPYAFLLAFRYSSTLVNDNKDRRTLIPLLVAVLLFAHVVPFGIATSRHEHWLNYRQERLMRLAEDLTDPVRDPVYDAIGMVPTRSIVDRRAFLHSLNISSIIHGPGPQIRDMLAANLPAVVIPSYRTDWLPEDDHDFICSRYVALADDFWVLGKVLPAGGGSFEIFHPGRYRISTLQGSDLADTYPLGMKGLITPEDSGSLTGTLDGLPLSNHPVQLAVGQHRIESTAGSQPAVVWTGPRLERVHRIGPGDHRALFFNWY
jgi:hypothetical protein